MPILEENITPQEHKLSYTEKLESLKQQDKENHAVEQEETNFLKPPIKHDLSAKRVFKGPQNERQKAVVEAVQFAWHGYKTYAWGFDHLLPHTGGSGNWFGLGLTLVDSLDTLYIMGMKDGKLS